MTVGELVYKQAIEQGHNPDFLKGLAYNIDNSIETYKKAFETYREPLKRFNSTVDSIRPQLKKNGRNKSIKDSKE